jgi:hypothetical protein
LALKNYKIINMNKTYLIAALAIAGILTACNSSTSENMEDTGEHMEGMEGMDGMNDGSAEINTSVEIREGQDVFFPNLKDGQTITLPFVVEFGVNGMTVEPAGAVNTDMGHHHLLVDTDAIPAGVMVPMNETNKHFGKGQTSDTLQLSSYPTLTPGAHTLTMQFADGIHSSYGPKMSKTIKIIVK